MPLSFSVAAWMKFKFLFSPVAVPLKATIVSSSAELFALASASDHRRTDPLRHRRCQNTSFNHAKGFPTKGYNPPMSVPQARKTSWGMFPKAIGQPAKTFAEGTWKTQLSGSQGGAESLQIGAQAFQSVPLVQPRWRTTRRLCEKQNNKSSLHDYCLCLRYNAMISALSASQF